MSPEEADVVRTFVRNGGTVIADVRPALYDGHCRPLEQGLLNDVFGIKQTGNRAAREIDRMSIAGELNGQKLAMRWGNWHGKDIYPSMKVDPNVALTTGKGLGDAAFIHYWTGLSAPMCVVNEFGKGRAILLNFSMFDAPVAGLLRGLLAASGVTPAVNVVKPDGTTPKDLEISRCSNGGIGLLCLLGKDNGPATVTLPEPTCVYDLKARRYLGKLQAFETSLRQNRASFFALLPKPAVEPTLNAPRSVRAGTVANITVRVPNATGDHAIMVRVTDPAGRSADWIGESLMVGQKPVRMDLPFAYNDSPGTWEVRAIDLYGNTTATEKVDVRPR